MSLLLLTGPKAKENPCKIKRNDKKIQSRRFFRRAESTRDEAKRQAPEEAEETLPGDVRARARAIPTSPSSPPYAQLGKIPRH